jgi:Ala-tRNA(Pro) deacylase
MPPFGHLYGLPMFVDPCLAGDEVFFQAGNHHEVVRMRWNDFERLASPFIGDTCLHGELVHVRR